MSINKIQVNEIYECQSDKELIVATVNASDGKEEFGGGRASVEIILIDECDQETRLAGAAVHFNGRANTWVFMNSASAVVVKGQKYKVKYDESAAPTTVEAHWQSL